MTQQHTSSKKANQKTHLLSNLGARNIFWILAALALIAWVIWEAWVYKTINLELTMVFTLGIATLVIMAFSINSHLRDKNR